VRERTGELGVMKAIGFTDGQVLSFVLAESLLIAVFGGAGGVGLWVTLTESKNAFRFATGSSPAYSGTRAGSNTTANRNTRSLTFWARTVSDCPARPS